MVSVPPPEAGAADAALASLAGARIVLGVSGGIAAYKAVEILRRLVDAGAYVAPVLTYSATRFVGVATFSALGSEPAQTELFGGVDPIPHTRLGRLADLVVVAPATARVVGEYAAGISRDLLGATLLATRAPVLLCPAMHTEMWEHPAVRENVATLRRRGVHVVDPGTGVLAGGDVGAGRLAEPEAVVAAAAAMLDGARRGLSGTRGDLAGVTVLVTAGGTREPIDPVRYVANRSSGRQGHAIAEVAAERGARVVLVTASPLGVPPGVDCTRVDTAAELAEAVLAHAAIADVVVMAAAVADFRPAAPAPTKLRKSDGIPEIRLEPTLDVLAALGRRRVPGQVLVGFAAETDDAVERGRRKLVDKGVDLVVVNDVSAPGAGFGHETNAVTLCFATGATVEVPLAPKRTIAAAVLDAVSAIRSGAAGASSAPADPAGGRGDDSDEGAAR